MKKPNLVVIGVFVGVLLSVFVLSGYVMYLEGAGALPMLLAWVAELPVSFGLWGLGFYVSGIFATLTGWFLWLLATSLTIFSGYRRARIGALATLALILLLAVAGICRQFLERGH